MSSARPSGIGTALMKILLCLLGDLDRHIMEDSSDTVSLNYLILELVIEFKKIPYILLISGLLRGLVSAHEF